jgi:hypothetical protein
LIKQDAAANEVEMICTNHIDTGKSYLRHAVVIITATFLVMITATSIAAQSQDTDLDGMPDDWEVRYQFDINDPNDAHQNPDGDVSSNLEEFRGGTNPRVADVTGITVDFGKVITTPTPTPLPKDADGDGMADEWETAHGLNPNDPGDGLLDPDQDGLSNLEESQLRSDPQLEEKAPEFQLGTNCTANIQNRVVQINANGTFAIPNVPVDEGLYKIRVVCVNANGTTSTGQSEFFMLMPTETAADRIKIEAGVADPIPVSIEMKSDKSVLGARGETAQLFVIGTMPSGIRDLTERSQGTTYSTSNPRVATVSNSGVVTAVSRGQVLISARNEGTLGTMAFNVTIPNDADDDGITDEFERANGLNPNDGTDAGQDADGDGLTNLQEFQASLNPRAADTDGDGLNDGGEITRGTNPLRADTDGDGLTDGQEVAARTNPTSADTDGDGISDGLETRLGLNPLVPDVTTTVQGRVVDSTGAAVADASAIVSNLLTASTDSTGYFRITQVPATVGSVSVLAQAIRNGQVLAGISAPIAPSGNGTTDVGTIQIGLDSGSISGLVT